MVPAHFDIVDYEGHITQMKASAATEQALAEAMERTYRDPVRPDLARAAVEAFDRSNSYACYVDLVKGLVGGKGLGALAVEKRSWVARTSNAG